MITNRERYIYYLSELYVGSSHDFGILKEEFPVDIDWLKDKKIIVDLAFLSIDDKYKVKELLIPFKKPRKTKDNPNPQLTEEQKLWNKAVSKIRIYVEHAIGGMKRFRVLVNRSRLKVTVYKNNIIGVCAGLWNFKLKYS